MVDRLEVITAKTVDKRCSKCKFGHDIVAGMFGGQTEEDGTETRWYLTNSVHLG